jgi:hypothetical protein
MLEFDVFFHFSTLPSMNWFKPVHSYKFVNYESRQHDTQLLQSIGMVKHNNVQIYTEGNNPFHDNCGSLFIRDICEM